MGFFDACKKRQQAFSRRYDQKDRKHENRPTPAQKYFSRFLVELHVGKVIAKLSTENNETGYKLSGRVNHISA
jgi:hypothetical protein